MRPLTTVTVVLAAFALPAAGCGEEQPSPPPTSPPGARPAEKAKAPEAHERERGEKPATAERAREEIGEVRLLLDRALSEHRRGRPKEAEELVGDAYLEHFEHVEGPLGERDHELMEELERTISTTVRERIKQGASPGEVRRLVSEAKRKLGKAEARLR